jgi:hypothetical protein
VKHVANTQVHLLPRLRGPLRLLNRHKRPTCSRPDTLAH